MKARPFKHLWLQLATVAVLAMACVITALADAMPESEPAVSLHLTD